MEFEDTCTESHRHFVDLDNCISLIGDIRTKLDDNKATKSDEQIVRSEIERLVDVFKKTIDKYQEQPDLIEPYLGQLIERLIGHLKDHDSQQASITAYHTSFKFLYQLVKVVGFKSFGRKLPHETDKLPLLVSLLEREEPEDKTNWQTRYVLTVWLSTVILTPFDLAKFDSDSSLGARMSDRIYSTLIKSLNHHDSCQHVTAYCLARLFTRSDMIRSSENLNLFIATALEGEVANVKLVASSTDDVKLIGHLRTLCYIFKFGPRDELKRRSECILSALLKSNLGEINRELVRHLYVKLLQRIGMASLPRRVAAWRYKRGSRILGRAFNMNANQELTINITDKTSTSTSGGGGGSGSGSGAHFADDGKATISTMNDHDDDGGVALMDEVEEEEEETRAAESLQLILGVLFNEARNSQTKIRWSAAKGLARVASRLSRERASEVIDNVLSSYFDLVGANEFAWHGGCLTLAEMARQGLILEEKLPAVIELVCRAILYDKIKGSCAIGAQVREAACYVFWAMSRTYEDHLLAGHITSISTNLLCTMLFDRELQCRRAASATFQELVGRQGTFNAEGISILTHLDYQSVGLRQAAYLELAMQVARFGPKYYEPFIEHLLEKKLGHWDIKIRRLASESLGSLMLYPNGEFVEANVLPQLSEMCQQNLDNNRKHGAILGLARVISGLKPLGYKFKPDLVALVGSMATRCEKQLKSKQQAANFIEAIASLIISSELAKFSFPDETLQQQWEPLTLQALDSDNAELRNIGSDCLLTLYRYFYSSNKSAQDRLLTILNRSLASPNESTRCGSLRSLSKLGLALSDSLVMSSSNGGGAGGAGGVSSGAQPVQAAIDAVATTTTTATTTYDDDDEQDQQQRQAADSKQTGGGVSGEIKVDSDTPDIILLSLTSYIGRETREKSTDAVLAHAKAEACAALATFVESLDKSRLVISRQWLRVGFDVLLEKTEDYTFDKRGDIGVVVRRAAVKALVDLSLYLASIEMSSVLLEDFDETTTTTTTASASTTKTKAAPAATPKSAYGNRLTMMVAKILQQCVSYNNSAREQAALGFYHLIRAFTQFGLRVPQLDRILQLFQQYGVYGSDGDKDGGREDGESFNWRDESMPIFVALLEEPIYNLDLWIGLVPAVSMASDLATKDSQLALIEDVRRMVVATKTATANPNGSNQPAYNMGAILEGLFVCLDTNKRLAANALKVVDCLVTRAQIDELDGDILARLVESCWRLRNTTTTTTTTANNNKPADLNRLLLVSRVMCSMLFAFRGQALLQCLKHCCELLVSSRAEVRVHTAEQMGCALSAASEMVEKLLEVFKETRKDKSTTMGGAGGASDGAAPSLEAAPVAAGPADELQSFERELDLDGAASLLYETDWSEPLDKVTPVRDQIYVKCFSNRLG